MKKIAGIICLSFLIITSCKKERKQTYEERLEGNWSLVSVKYSGSAPNPLSGTMMHFEGAGQSVSGTMNVRRNPYEMDYDFNFMANVELSDTLPPVPINISESGSGTWTTTTDESRIILTTPDEVFNFDVLVNEPERQVYTTKMQRTVYQFITVETDVEMEFHKK